MEKKIITFGGITNVPDDGLNEAGDMSVLLNMRHKGGELVPCQPPSKDIGQLGSYTQNHDISQVVYHAQSGRWLMNVYYPGGDGTKEGRYVVIFKDGFLFDNIGPNGKASIFPKDDELETFSVMGNIVIMSCKNSVQYAIWRDGVYEFLGALPEVPEMKITTEAVVVETSAGESYYNYTAFDESRDIKWPLFSKGFFDKCLDECYDKKLYIDNALFVVGFKMFDGSYRYSQLYLVDTYYGGNLPANFKTIALKRPDNWGGGTSAQMKVVIYGKKVGFIMNYDLSFWKDVILSVDIFTSGSIMSHKATNEKLYVYTYDSTQETGIKTSFIKDAEIYTPKPMPEIRKEIETCSSFYKIESYDLKGQFINGVDNTSPSNLSVQPRLPVNNSSLVFGGSTLVYNNRLHTFNSYNRPVFSSNNGYFISETDDIEEKNTSIKVGENVYVGKIKIPKEQKWFTNIISHPRQNVKKQIIENSYEIDFLNNPFMDISVALGCSKKNDYLVTIKSVTMTGTLFEDENSSNDYYINFNIETFLEKVQNKVGDYTLYTLYNNKDFVVIDGVVKEESLSDYGINFQTRSTSIYQGQRFYITVKKQETCYDISRIQKKENVGAIEKKNDINEKNILRVSAVDNPFYFPTAQTYKFEGEIVGLASNAEAISTGQFGQYPLFVFTDTGIWAMGVDTSGQGAYTTQSPFSREVCNGAICPVSGGVVFSTDKGVMAISNGQVADLSAVLDGFEVDFFEENAGMWEDIFAKAGKDDVVNPVPIREYIKGAVIAYNYHYNEIIVSNNKKGYSYVYSLTNKVWSVIDVVFDLTTNKYPELVVFDKGEGCMYTFKDGAALNKVVAITRPFTLGSIDFKRIRQAGLRTTFNGRLNFYVLGSIDGAVFKCITGKEVDADVANPNGGTYRDLITAMSRSKQYKYFAIAIAGQMSGRVSMAELLVDAGFANNKIR